MKYNRDRNQQIIADRQRLRNPYAHLDANGKLDAVMALDVWASQNPYASLAINGVPQPLASLNSRTNLIDAQALFISTQRWDIEESANRLLRYRWEQHGGKGVDPILMINVKAAAEALGISLIEVDPMGLITTEAGEAEIAATLDRHQKTIRISTRPDKRTQNFTAAHELGHWILHRDQIQYHRDLPVIDSRTRSHSPIERQANWFAVAFLMPSRLVKRKFRERFGENIPFKLSTDNAVGLTRSSYVQLLRKTPSIEELAFIMAKAEFFHGDRFISLADEFNVNVSAMAYRLIELKLMKAS